MAESQIAQINKYIDKKFDRFMDREFSELKGLVSEQGKSIAKLEVFKATTIEQIKAILINVQAMQDNFKWMNRGFIGMVITGVVTILINIITRVIGG